MNLTIKTKNRTQLLQKRINTAGNAKYFWSSLLASKPLRYIIRPVTAYFLSGILLRLSAILFDFFESIRRRSWVSGFGDYRSTLMKDHARIKQHKHYPTYKYIKSTHTLVGIHVGVDLIKSEGVYYPLEFNLNAGIRKEMKEIYKKDLDPIILNYVTYARDHGYAHVRMIHSNSKPYFSEEIKKAKRICRYDIESIHHLGKRSKTRDFITGLPEKLASNTLYIIFTARHTPIEFIVHNKYMMNSWLEAKIKEKKGQFKRIKAIPIWSSFDLPKSIFSQQKWPQIVLKLAGWDRGTQIKLVKARDLKHAKTLLGITRDNDFPKIFDLSLLQKIAGNLSTKNKVIYQQFIPSEVDKNGYLKIFRLHCFFSPKSDLFLTTLPTIGSEPLSTIPFGIISNDGSLTPKFLLDGKYKLPSITEEMEQRQVCAELGMVLRDIISEKFEVFEG